MQQGGGACRIRCLPRGGGPLLDGGGGVGPVGEGALGGHDQGEGDTGLTGALAVGVGDRHWVDAAPCGDTREG